MLMASRGDQESGILVTNIPAAQCVTGTQWSFKQLVKSQGKQMNGHVTNELFTSEKHVNSFW